MVAVERQRRAIASFGSELKKKKKAEAVQNYGRISDLKQCTFQPALTMTSLQFADNDQDRGDMWKRIKTDLAQKEQKIKDVQRVQEESIGIMTRQKKLNKAEEFMKEYIGKPDSEFRVDMVEDALVDGKRKNQITEKEYDVIAKKKGEDKLLAAYNVLRIHG